MKILLRFLLVAALSLAVVKGWFYLNKPSTLPIKHAKIVGSFTHIERQPLQALLAPYLEVGFLGADFAPLKQCVLEMPWVEAIHVERVWPDTVVVHISEQQAIARWGNDGLLGASGQVFRPPLETFPKDLPLLQPGALDQPADLLQVYRQIAVILLPLHESVASLDGSEQYSWRVMTGHGTLLLLSKATSANRLNNSELSNFARTYDKIFVQSQQHPVSVDLRYPNGFAVRWN